MSVVTRSDRSPFVPALGYNERVIRDRVIVTTSVIVAMFALMLVLERWFPLRRTTENKPRRIARNLTLGAMALVAGELLQFALVLRVAGWAEGRGVGVVPMLPAAVQTLAAVVLLDYTLWWWHWMNHRIPFFWRFHLVHHIDRDLDVSTGLRFHFGEHALSAFFRCAQIVVIGASTEAVWIWQTILFASILFHHANVRLPQAVERWLVRVIVTPRMHGIHHSNRQDEANSNWSSMLSIWDVLHRTMRMDVPQEKVTIGVPAYSRDEDVKLGVVVRVPFGKQRDDWRSKLAAIGNYPHQTAVTASGCSSEYPSSP